jgi:hypothetical protein
VTIEAAVGEPQLAHEFGDSNPLDSASTELLCCLLDEALMGLLFVLCGITHRLLYDAYHMKKMQEESLEAIEAKMPSSTLLC